MILTLSYYKRKEFLIILRKYAELRKARNKCRKTRKADPSTVSRKQSTPSFSKMEHLLPPDTHTNMHISGGKKCSFFGKFGVLCFLETPGLRFAFLPYYRRLAKPLRKKTHLSKRRLSGLFYIFYPLVLTFPLTEIIPSFLNVDKLHSCSAFSSLQQDRSLHPSLLQETVNLEIVPQDRSPHPSLSQEIFNLEIVPLWDSWLRLPFFLASPGLSYARVLPISTCFGGTGYSM